MNIKMQLRAKDRVLYGFGRAIGPRGSFCFCVKLDMMPIIRAVARAAWDRMERHAELSGVTTGDLYEVGFFGKLFRWVKKTVKKIANSKFIKGIVKAVKWVVNSPIVKGIVGIAKFIPFIGPVINDAHKAISGVDKVVKKAVAGNPLARRIVAQVADKAKGGNAVAVNMAHRMLDAAKKLDPAQVAQVAIPAAI